jgi:hypothetical protein
MHHHTGVLAHGRAAAVLTALVASAVLAAIAPPARADGPGVGTPAIVTVGDSYISGEAGRWAGNASSESYVDALGSTAYDDNSTNSAETIPYCHRSHADEAYVGGGLSGKDLACSGAKTSTFWDSSGDFKPGLDFYDDGSGDLGQALQLQNYAKSHNVKIVAVSIGGNNYNFGSIVQDCVTDYVTTWWWFWPDYCKDDSSVTSNFTSSNIAAQTSAITTALLNVGKAMTNAGYSSSQWTLVVQDYPSPVPNGSGFRYSQGSGVRQSTGGCGFFDTDASYANSSMLPTINSSLKNAAAATGLPNVKYVEMASAFNGRRLCENTVDRVDHTSYSSWSAPGAVDHIEWFQGIRTVTTLFSDYFVQESLHPDYYAQLAERNCLRQAYNGGTPRGGTCLRSSTGGLDSQGEPNMTLG